jgi:two-component system nitrate/nitrite response regulator NarL
VISASDSGKKIRVLLVDDHTIFRQGVARLLNAEPDLELKLHCARVGEALLAVAAGLVDVVLLDLDLGAERGTDFLAQARKNGFQGPVLVLAAAIPEEEKTLLEAHGVSATLRKDASVELLAQHIRQAMGASQSPRRADGASARRPPVAGGRPFSARESIVLRMVVEGMANKEIAGELSCTENVVKSVVQQLFRKTGTNTRSQLVRAALESHRDQL